MSVTPIPLSIPIVKGNAWKYVKDCLDSGWVSSVGSYVNDFENKGAALLSRRHAVACVNGTAALHTALMVLGLKAGEEVIMPDLTFAAPSFAVKYCGAYPVFIDAEPTYAQMDIDKLEDFLKRGCTRRGTSLINKATRRVVRGILPVHLLGHPCDIVPIVALAKTYGLWVVEDVAESIGASYKSKPVGSHADMATLSFNGNKIITCGGGGMLLTNNATWAKRARYLTTQAKDHPLEYIHHAVGYNYRLTNIQAALGLSQVEELSNFIAQKRAIAAGYIKGLQNIDGLRVMQEAPWAKSIFWLNTIVLQPKIYGHTARQLQKVMEAQGIHTRPLWHPLSGLPIFKDCYAHRIETSSTLYQNALNIPSSANLNRKDQHRVMKCIKN